MACRLLNRTTGGFLHIHQNVTSPLPNIAGVPEHNDVALRGKKTEEETWQGWACDTAHRISCILRDVTGARWITKIKHIEHVKSYAPHVQHVVLDLECRPRHDHLMWRLKTFHCKHSQCKSVLINLYLSRVGPNSTGSVSLGNTIWNKLNNNCSHRGRLATLSVAYSVVSVCWCTKKHF